MSPALNPKVYGRARVSEALGRPIEGNEREGERDGGRSEDELETFLCHIDELLTSSPVT